MQSEFLKEMWGKLNNNPIESWNNWMCALRQMSIPSLMSGHLQKLGCKMDNRKVGVAKWKNGVGERMEKKLKKTCEKMGSVVEVQRFNRGIVEYSVRLTNDRCLVVRLRDGTCSCKWWQLCGLPCVHAMAVIEREKLYVHDYVNPCYKAPTQRTIYMNAIHPMETHDTGVVDGDTGLVVGGDDLDEDFNRRILPPKNPRGAGRPKKRRVESQTQGLKPRRCSKCGDLRHYKDTCRNLRAVVDADYPGDVVAVEDLFSGNYRH